MASLNTLNSADQSTFVAVLGHLFEHSPWVAEQTWTKRPFRDAAQLHAELCTAMQAAPGAQQLALIRAHPDLAGRLAQQNKLTAESTREQAGAGLNQLTDSELAEFTRLNAKSAILAAMQARLPNSPATEHAAALAEIEKIAWLRLQDSLRQD